jgi:hypothetical protein
MGEASSFDEILEKAKAEEKRYEWLKATDYYQKALTTVAETDFLRKGEISEKLAYAVYKAAFQADNSHEFKERMGHALTCYGEAKKLYEKSPDVKKTPRIYRCDAMIAFAGYWLATTGAERRRSVERCGGLTKQVFKSFTAEEKWEFGSTFTQLFLGNYLLLLFLDDYDSQVTLGSELIKCGEQAIAYLSQLEDPFNLAKAYAQTAILLELYGTNSPDPADQNRIEQKALSYAVKAKQFSEEAALLECYYVLGADLDSDRITADGLKALNYARKATDKFAIGSALTAMSINMFYKVQTTENSEERRELLRKFLEYAEQAKNEFDKLAWTSIPYTLDFWAEACYTMYFTLLASDEIDLLKRRDLLQKAVDSAHKSFGLAEETGSPLPSAIAHGMLSRAYFYNANIETNSDTKKTVLEQALQHRSEYTKLMERYAPTSNFPIGLNRARAADIKYQIANLTAGSEDRKKLLREAIQLMQDGLSLMGKDLQGIYRESKGSYAHYGNSQFEHAEMLSTLYKLTNEEELSEKAMEEYRQAAETFRNHDFASRSAECWWRTAEAYDARGEYLKAAEHFELASKDYHIASDKIPRLKGFYEDHAIYMKAWTEIEKGRHHHERQEYGTAEENFRRAADMHKASTRWNYLAPSYAAWASVERAEELSRKERSEEASEGFQRSVDLLKEAKRSIQCVLDRIGDSDEKRMAASLIKATGSRREHCEARIIIEEAKILAKKGEHRSSAKQYGSAAETLEKLTQKLESQPDVKECQFIACLSRAWQKMQEAEAEESPQYYDEASRLFENAKGLGQNEKTKTLMLGHSRFCKALEAGAKFADTRDMTDYTRSMQYLDSASGYYLKSDFKSASDYVKATRLLFDAYIQMGNAAREIDLDKKSRLYLVAEKVLQASADSYAKAGNPSGKEQALKLLETAKEQRELTISLAEVLQAPIVASTTAFAPPAPTSEKAVGLERFEHAEVNANLIISRKELKVGESVDLEIELANPGKGQALLTQIEEAFPESFDLTTKPESYRVEGHNINLKGRRLDPLKTEEVKFSVKPKHKGSFTVRPRILYLDENGNAKSHQPEPLTITVKELGIKGWITGEA